MNGRIDIDRLSEAELIDLSRRVVERLRFIRQMHAHRRMLDFSIGDRVSFQPPGRGRLFGVLTRYNKKTVTVITEQGEQWNVAPTLLSKVFEGGVVGGVAGGVVGGVADGVVDADVVPPGHRR